MISPASKLAQFTVIEENKTDVKCVRRFSPSFYI